MNCNPHTHLEIARQRHGDMLREAQERELARSVADPRPGPIARLRGLLGTRAAKQPLARPV